MKKGLVALTLGFAVPAMSLATEIWDESTVYTAGSLVSHHGNTFVASHRNQGNAPEVNDFAWDGWLYTTKNTIDIYDHETAYRVGDIIDFKGHIYVAQWPIKGEYPHHASSSWRQVVNVDLTPAASPITDTDPNENPKSLETVRGLDNDGDGIRDSYKQAVLTQYDNPVFVQMALSISHEYDDLYRIVFDDTIAISPQEAAQKLNSITAFEACARYLYREGIIQDTPLSLFANTIYRALYYRLGTNRLFARTNDDLDALQTFDPPCPASLSKDMND